MAENKSNNEVVSQEMIEFLSELKQENRAFNEALFELSIALVRNYEPDNEAEKDNICWLMSQLAVLQKLLR